MIKVKETKETEQRLTLKECFALSVSRDDDYCVAYRDAAKSELENEGYVSFKWDDGFGENGYHGCTGTIRKETTRPATTEEIQAYLILKYVKEVCQNGPMPRCNPKLCYLAKRCPIGEKLIQEMETILKGKEVYEE